MKYSINERVILCEGKRGLFNKGKSKYKAIPKEYFTLTPTQIYGNTIHILLGGNPDYLIIIRNKQIADSYRKQFELLWSIAQPLKTTRKPKPR